MKAAYEFPRRKKKIKIQKYPLYNGKDYWQILLQCFTRVDQNKSFSDHLSSLIASLPCLFFANSVTFSGLFFFWGTVMEGVEGKGTLIVLCNSGIMLR